MKKYSKDINKKARQFYYGAYTNLGNKLGKKYRCLSFEHFCKSFLDIRINPFNKTK